jgi:hypothetical protein
MGGVANRGTARDEQPAFPKISEIL